VCAQRETDVNAHLFILALGSACYPLLLAIVLVLLTVENRLYAFEWG
jgi:hypothetical protein